MGATEIHSRIALQKTIEDSIRYKYQGTPITILPYGEGIDIDRFQIDISEKINEPFESNTTPREALKFINNFGIYRISSDEHGNPIKIIIKRGDQIIEFKPEVN